MDRKLHALVKLDVTSDVVRIDVRGSLNHDSRPALVLIIRRIRRMGITAHIRVDLSRAAFVESVALAGLRNDLNAIDGGASDGRRVRRIAGSRSISCHGGTTLAARLRTRVPGPVDITGEFAASIDPSGCGPLARLLRRRTACGQRLGVRNAGRSRCDRRDRTPGALRRDRPGNFPAGERRSRPEGRRRTAFLPVRPGMRTSTVHRVLYPASAVATVEVCHVPRSQTREGGPGSAEAPPAQACRRTQAILPAELPGRRGCGVPAGRRHALHPAGPGGAADQQDPDSGRTTSRRATTRTPAGSCFPATRPAGRRRSGS